MNKLPGPDDLWQGFLEIARGVWPVWLAIALLLLFGEPFVQWLAR